MPDLSQTSPAVFPLQGGLVLNKSTFAMQPGEAIELVNFEPDINGGYRRINGFAKYNTNVVPQTSAWTERDSGRTSAGVYTFERFNFDGNDKLIVADGNNAPTVFNTSFAATDVSSGGGGEVSTAVTGAKFVAVFKDHMFYAGMSNNKQEVVFSVPFDEDNFATGSGAGSFKVDDTITGLKVFREDLFVFCQDRIFKLSGTSSSNFAVTPVTRNIGCVNGQTIQEFAGDLIFLAPDGLRTVAGTARIGDVELGTISSPVQSVFNNNIANASGFRSLVIPNKTQYRVFFTKSGVLQAVTEGILTSLRGQSFEFANIKGIRPTSTDTVTTATETIVIHGGDGGYVYRQESGNDFDGTAVGGKYRSPDLSFGDPGIRKHMHRVLVSYKPEASISADMFLRYDYEDPDAPRPAAYSLTASDIVAVYGTGVYGTATYGGQSEPLLRQSVEGSGFTVALRVDDNGTTAPYALRGFQMEYQTGARR
jgi:hypothetical protein